MTVNTYCKIDLVNQKNGELV